MPLTERSAEAPHSRRRRATKWNTSWGDRTRAQAVKCPGDRRPGGSAWLGEGRKVQNPTTSIEVYRHRTGAALSLSRLTGYLVRDNLLILMVWL